MNRRGLIAAIGLALAAVLVLAVGPVRVYSGLRRLASGESSIEDRIRQYGPAAEARLKERFAAAGATYPPSRLVMVGLKEERQFLLLVPGPAGTDWREAARYRILGASGGPGPKLRRGDGQVPEGFYSIESLNPNSLYHLSLRVDYPNREDREHGRNDGRKDLGSDIMIHGKDASVGCLAIGDPAVEEVFVVVHRVGLDNIELVLAPSARPRPAEGSPAWVAGLYQRLEARLRELGVDGAGGR